MRLLVNDDLAQAERPSALFETRTDEDEAIWIADIVLIETVWTPDRIYARSRPYIDSALHALASNATGRLESSACITVAISLYAQGPAEFADWLLAVNAPLAGCEALRSFDRKMLGLPGVELL